MTQRRRQPPSADQVGAMFGDWGKTVAGHGADACDDEDEVPCVPCPSCHYLATRLAYVPGKASKDDSHVCAFCVPEATFHDAERGWQMAPKTERGRNIWQLQYVGVAPNRPH